MTSVLLALVTVFMFAIPSFAQESKDQCPEKLYQAQASVKDLSITESLLETEVNQKRKQVATLGRQLQEERIAHEATKKALAKAQSKPEAEKK